MRKSIFAILVLTLILLISCESRFPDEIIEFEGGLSLLVTADPDADIDAIKDTLSLEILLKNAENNQVSLVGRESDLSFTTNHGVILGYNYYYPYETDTVLKDTLKSQFIYNDGLDTAFSELEITIHPLQNSIGFLPPDYLNVNMRTDTIYQSGAFWNMFVDAIVSDSLGDPVEDGVAVLFSIVSSSVDTSLISIGNLAATGDEASIGDISDQIVGEAINVFFYDSEAIGATVVVKAAVRDNPEIFDLDTLILPLPKHNLQLKGHDLSGGLVKVKKTNDNEYAKFRVTLRDAFNIPVPYHSVNVSSLGGSIVPNAAVYDADSNVIGSQPVIFTDSTIREECFTWDSLIVDTIIPDSIDQDTLTYIDDAWKIWEPYTVDTLCDPEVEPLYIYYPSFDTLDYPYSGITNDEGEFEIYILLSSNDKPADPDINTITVPVTLEEESTHYTNTDFSFSVLFY